MQASFISSMCIVEHVVGTIIVFNNALGKMNHYRRDRKSNMIVSVCVSPFAFNRSNYFLHDVFIYIYLETFNLYD